MEVRKATLNDLDAMMDIVIQARAYFKEAGVDQWQNGEGPNETILTNDINLGNSYVVEDEGKVIGMSCIIVGEEPDYDYIEGGKWLNDEPFVVMHRVAIDNAHKGKGVVSLLFKKAEELALENGRHNIRIDTHKDNLSMQRTIQKMGFSYRGVIYLKNGAPRNAYQKEI